MAFTLHPFAAVRGIYVVQFQDDSTPLKGCTILPVVADPDPTLASDEKLWGPEYEVLEDRVRAYGNVLKVEEDLLDRIAKLEARLEERLTAVELMTKAF